MRYVSLASASYGSGTVIACAGRLGWRNSGGQAITHNFSRKILEYCSQKSSTDIIEVCHVPIQGVDGVVPTIDYVNLSSVSRRDVDFLSEDNNLSRFDCIIISGYSSSSPLVRNNLLSYVSSGGGLLIEDFRATGTIDILNAISDFSISDDSFFQTAGATLWTDEGRLASLFSESFLSEPLPLLNTIDVDDVGSGWELLMVFDTDREGESGEDTEFTLVSSDDVDIPGEYFMASYRSTYKDGVIDVEK